jgi:hypothetical protein
LLNEKEPMLEERRPHVEDFGRQFGQRLTTKFTLARLLQVPPH